MARPIGIALLVILLTALTPLDSAAEVEQVELKVDGLTCPFCYYNLQKPLKKIPAFESLKSNYKKGLVRASVKPGEPLDLASIRQAVADTGFTLRTIRITVVGMVGEWEDKSVLESQGTGQLFLLYQGKEGQGDLTPEYLIGDPTLARRLAAWRSNGIAIRVTGIVHEHKGMPPALSIETVQELKS